MPKLPQRDLVATAPGWLRGWWHLVLLVAAVLFLSVAYLPQILLSGLNSDFMIPAIFYQDLTHGGHARDWWWGGASFLFPDLTLCFLFNYLLGDGLAALQAVAALFYLLWFVAVVAGYAACGFKNCGVFATCVALLGVAMVWDWSFQWDFGIAFFFPVDHGGGYLMALALLAGVQRLWRLGWKGPLGLVLLVVVNLLTSASDSLMVIILTGPVVATMLLAAFRFPAERKRALILAGAIGGSALAGYLLAGTLFGPHLATGLYTRFNLDSIPAAFCKLRENFDFAHNGPIPFLSVADGLLFVAAAWALWRVCRRRDSGRLSPALFFLLAYTVSLLAMNWDSVIITGIYLGRETTRYVVLSLLWPLLLLAGWLSASINWRLWARQVFALAVGGLCLAVGLHPPDPTAYHDRKQRWIPALAALFKQEHTTAALGDYWYSNIVTVLSGGAVPIRQLTGEGLSSHWFANVDWYRQEPPGGFRLILTPNLDPEMIRAHFGSPQRITDVAGINIWIYAPENALHYIPAFQTVGNTHSFPTPNTYRVTAPGMPHQTGVLEGGSIVARPERDASETIGDGPCLFPLPGHYRVEFTYAFLAPPQKGLEPIFDAAMVDHGVAVVLQSELLPQSGPGTQTAAQECTILPTTPGQLQVRIQYFKSGIVRVDSQTITRLGP